MRLRPEVEQTDNTVSGDMAARDINKPSTTFNYNHPSVRISKIKELFARYEQEKQSNVQFNQIVAELQHYITPRQNETVIGIEGKLAAAKRDAYIEYALEVKEHYAKKLTIHEMFESSQLINVYLLALVKSKYMHHVYPLVIRNEDDLTINNAIDTHVLNPLLEQLEGDTLGFTSEDIIGMLYFLTGNCHIKWSQHANI